MTHESGEERPLAAVEEVRCLECGQIYPKPAGGGTARANPGCPTCGYVGWLSVAIPVNRAAGQRRFGGGPMPHQSVQPG